MEVVPRFFLYGEQDRIAQPHFLHIETIGSRSTRHQRRIAPHRHSSLVQLFLVAQGGGTVLIDRARRGFAAPSLLWMPTSVIHGFEFGSGTEGWVLTLAESYAAEILREAGAAEATRELVEPLLLALEAESADFRRLSGWFETIAQECRWKSLGWAESLSALLRLIFIAAARLEAEDAARASALGPDAGLFARFRALVEAWHCEHRPLADYAAALSVTEKRLTRLCRRIAGQSPARLVQARLAAEAERSLLYSTLGVAEIGYALGFRDPAYFSRFCRRELGTAPRDLARRGRAADAG